MVQESVLIVTELINAANVMGKVLSIHWDILRNIKPVKHVAVLEPAKDVTFLPGNTLVEVDLLVSEMDINQ